MNMLSNKVVAIVIVCTLVAGLSVGFVVARNYYLDPVNRPPPCLNFLLNAHQIPPPFNSYIPPFLENSTWRVYLCPVSV